jgi:hypothetical protein
VLDIAICRDKEDDVSASGTERKPDNSLALSKKIRNCTLHFLFYFRCSRNIGQIQVFTFRLRPHERAPLPSVSGRENDVGKATYRNERALPDRREHLGRSSNHTEFLMSSVVKNKNIQII